MSAQEREEEPGCLRSLLGDTAEAFPPAPDNPLYPDQRPPVGGHVKMQEMGKSRVVLPRRGWTTRPSRRRTRSGGPQPACVGRKRPHEGSPSDRGQRRAETAPPRWVRRPPAGGSGRVRFGRPRSSAMTPSRSRPGPGPPPPDDPRGRGPRTPATMASWRAIPAGDRMEGDELMPDPFTAATLPICTGRHFAIRSGNAGPGRSA